jgi:hypothetical protein
LLFQVPRDRIVTVSLGAWIDSTIENVEGITASPFRVRAHLVSIHFVHSDSKATSANRAADDPLRLGGCGDH